MNTSKQTGPPKWMQVILHRFAGDETLEEVEGDLLEFYQQWIKDHGCKVANLKYLATVITLLRPFRKKKKEFLTTTFFVMIRSYFLMSWRTILKNKVSTIINLSGLTLGLTTSFLILLAVIDEYSYDQFHEKKDSIYAMMKNQTTNEGTSTGRSTPGPLADALRSDYPEIVHAARVAPFGNIRLQVADARWRVNGVYTESDLFQMMTFSSRLGDAASALDRNMIVISKKMATQLFGDDDPIGKTVVFDGYHTLAIGAVIDDIPETSSLNFEVAVPFKVLEKNNDWLKKWDDNRIHTWVELQRNADIPAFNSKVSLLLQTKSKDPYGSLFAYPLSELHLRSRFSNGQPSGGKIDMVRVLVGFGVFMLLVACVNFMNIATAQSSYRAKEVGIRKVLGAARRWIVLQFLNEAFVITTLALITAIGLTILVIPSFNLYTHSSISFGFKNGITWLLIVAITVVTAVIAGSYPAFVLSRFAPVKVLKGLTDRPRGLSMRRILVTFQFIVSISVLVGTIILFAQFDHIKSRPMGYSQQNLINVRLDSLATTKFAYIKNEVLQIPGTKDVTGMSGNILHSDGAVTGMDWPGKKPGEDLSVVVTSVGYDWAQTTGIQIIKGRDFSQQFKSDEQSCLLNESAVEQMGLENPIGSIVGGSTVVGVFRNYVYNNPSGVVSPMAVYLSPTGTGHLYVRIDDAEAWIETVRAIEQVVKKASPDIEFAYSFTSDEYQAHFDELSQAGTMISVFGGMTIFISCLGLFGLSGFIADKRSKEMSIRKVFGADSLRVLMSLSGDVLKPVVAALLIVIPLSIWVADAALGDVVYRVSLHWWMFTKAAFIVLLIAVTIVVYHSWRAARENPALRLKSE